MDALATIDRAMTRVGRYRGLILPLLAAGMIFVIIRPLAPWLLDVLLAGSIALSAIILITCLHTSSPLEFSAFPSLLLVATMTRLVLNVATTRLILTAGADGRTLDDAQLAAGKVVWTFSRMVTSDSLAVGVVLFLIIAIIQFIVVTRGAARVSEVAARFVLDAMPGKQMAIDSDLSNSLITQDQARQRRKEISQEADFFGAMDGSSKFLRGDAIASVVIMAVNIVGGLYIGRMQYGWGWGETVELFTRLTVGEGLVMQTPALITSLAAALIVTRGGAQGNLGEQVVSQLFVRPLPLAITAGFLALLSLTPLPSLPLLSLAAVCGSLAYVMHRRRGRTQEPVASDAGAAAPPAQRLDDLLSVDPVRIELGYALVRLADASQGGDLLERVGSLRRQIATELGMLIPPVKIRDALNLESHAYGVHIRGQKVAAGKLYPNQLLAVASARSTAGQLTGRPATDPISGRTAVWISPSQKDQAELMNYSILSASDALIAHLGEIIRLHAAQLLTREQVAKLLDSLQGRSGSLVAEAKQKLSLGRIQRVLQNLLRERVAIRDLEAVLESLSDASAHSDDVEVLTESVRATLGSALSGQYCGQDGKLWCVCLDGELEEAICSQIGQGRAGAVVPAEMAPRLTRAVTEALDGLKQQGRPAVILCAPQVRAALRKLISPAMPEAAVLAYSEIESADVHSTATVGIGI